MKKRLIDYHREWEIKKQIPTDGLCLTFDKLPVKYRNTFELFEPSTQEVGELDDSYESCGFWAAGLDRYEADFQDIRIGYTPRRQAIILLICAMHNEL